VAFILSSTLSNVFVTIFFTRYILTFQLAFR